MPSHARAIGGDPHASARGRQRLKLAAIGYAAARHGVDADPALAKKAVVFLCRMALEFAETLPGARPKRVRGDLSAQGDVEALTIPAIAYASARHGIDADVGMAREGLAMLCQGAISYYESMPDEDAPKRTADPRLQIGNGNGARP